jgi:hypothetical protein
VIKKLAAGMCCAAIATLALAGCSDSDDQANAYAKKVCDQVQSQQAAIQKASDSISSVSAQNVEPKVIQQTDSAAFGQMADAYSNLATAVQSAGAPPVDKGADIQKNAVSQLNTMADSYTKLQKDVQGLDTGDQGKFADGLNSLTTHFTPLIQSGNDALAQLQSGDIGKAMARQPGCTKGGASASPTGA